MKICPNCSAELEDDVVVCPSCERSEESRKSEVKPAKNYATDPVTLPTVLGLVSLASGNLYASLIMSIIGLVLGIKEKKATGNSLSVILNSIALGLSSLGFLAVIGYFVIYFFTMFMVIMTGTM